MSCVKYCPKKKAADAAAAAAEAAKGAGGLGAIGRATSRGVLRGGAEKPRARRWWGRYGGVALVRRFCLKAEEKASSAVAADRWLSPACLPDMLIVCPRP